MNTLKDLKNMEAICEARYAMRQANFAKLIAEENRLREELGRLDAMRHDNRATSLEHVSMQAIGADVIWNGWLGQTKTALNMALAKVLAKKENHISEVRHAFGKLTVVQRLLKDAQIDHNQGLKRSALAAAVKMSLDRRRNQ